jgi:hypothetical protein
MENTMAVGFSKIVSKNQDITQQINKIGLDNKFLNQEKIDLLASAQDFLSEIQGVKPDDFVDPNPEPLPTTPTDAVARFYEENGKLTLEVVFTAADNTGAISTSFQVERNDDPHRSVPSWHLVGTVTSGKSWEEYFDVLVDLPYQYRVRGFKVIEGVTYYSAYSNIADPEPFVPHTNDGDRVTVQPGSLNAKSGKFKGVAGTYTLTDPESKLDFKGVDGTVIEIASGAMLTHRGASNVVFTNVVFDGKGKAGGEAGPDNAKAMIQPGDGWRFTDCVVQNGRGVLVGGDGSGIRATRVKCLNGGSAGWGGKCDNAILINVSCENCNTKNTSTDGAAFGKMTRTAPLIAIDCSAKKGTNATLWGDINNGNWLIINFQSEDISYSNTSKKWTGAGFKVEISANKSEQMDALISLAKEAGVLGTSETLTTVTETELKTYNFTLINCSSVRTKSYCFDLNETKDVLLRNCSGTTPESTSDGGHGSTRDLQRSDAGSKNPPRDKDWRCYNIVFKNFKVLDGDTFIFWGGGAGNQIDGNKHKIKIINPIAKDGSPAKLSVKRATNIKISAS